MGGESNLYKILETVSGIGVVWTLEGSEELNANLVRPAGGGVGEHVNDEVDVLFVGVSGSGTVTVDGEEHVMEAGTLLFVPRGARRSTRSVHGGFAYLTVHRRRGPLRIGRRTRPGDESEVEEA